MTERKHLPILSPGGLCSALLDLLFPPRCPFCHKLLAVGERGLCSACQKDLPWLTGAEAGQKGEFYRLCVSPLRYQGQVRINYQQRNAEAVIIDFTIDVDARGTPVELPQAAMAGGGCGGAGSGCGCSGEAGKG